MRKAIIVTGTPGTGKTAFSKGLAKALGSEYVSLADYASQHRLYAGFDKSRKSRIYNIEKVRGSLENTLREGDGYVVIDTNVPDAILPKSKVKTIIVLRCHPKVLEARLRKKGWPMEKVKENILAEILDSCLTSAVQYFGRERVVQIDTTNRNTARCVSLARAHLKGLRSGRGAKADWIRSLEREGVLAKYLK